MVAGNNNPAGILGGGTSGSGQPMIQQGPNGQTGPAWGGQPQGFMGPSLGTPNPGVPPSGLNPVAMNSGQVQNPAMGGVPSGLNPVAMGGNGGAVVGTGTSGNAPPPSTIPGITSTGTTMPGMTGNDPQRLLGEQQSIYGQGIGAYLTSLLNNGGMNMGLVNQVNAADLGAMQGNIASGAANLNTGLGDMGVSGNSSTAALANSNYQNQASSAENAMVSQNMMSEYNQGQQLIGQVLPGVLNQNAKNTANQFNWMDALGMGTGLLGDFAGLGGVSGIGSMFGGGGGGGNGPSYEEF